MYQMETSAWDKAFKLGHRVFYERATETLRTCPENYCIAVRQRTPDGYKWTLFLDGSLEPYRAVIAATLSTWVLGSTGDAIAEELGKVIPRKA